VGDSWWAQDNGVPPRGRGYQRNVSVACEDPTWDAFLAETAGGDHVQTSLWARVKAPRGWRAVRLVVTRDGHIVAGAQLLKRSWAHLGGFGYVPSGPVVGVPDPALYTLVVEELHRLARAHRLHYLVVQPPVNGQAVAARLQTGGFRPSPLVVAEAITFQLDLTRDIETILAQMKPKTRYNLRLGLRRGVTVRQGDERDLPTFHALYLATSRRQGFPADSLEYFSHLWRVFHPHGNAELFIAQYAGDAVSALLAVPFGDTVLYKRGGWSGRCGDRRPNEVMHWAAIRWAKSRGFRSYNFGDVDLPTAMADPRGGQRADRPADMDTVTRFKLGFGGQVTPGPPAFDYVYNAPLRWAYDTLFRKLASPSLGVAVRHRLL